MTVSSLAPVASGDLGDLVEGLAARSGAWAVLERSGRVLAHGAGSGPCPTGLVDALLSKNATGLRAVTSWQRSTRPMRGVLQDVPVVVWERGDGTRVWLLGGDASRVDVATLVAASSDGRQALPRDPLVDDLLHPRGPARGRAPAARLLILDAAEGLHELASALHVAVTGMPVRLHVEDGMLLAALDPGTDPQPLVDLVRRRCPSVVAGHAPTAEGATDWVLGWQLALGGLRAARRLGTVLGDPADTNVVAELVIAEAAEAVADLGFRLPHAPLARLRAHDQQTSGQLEQTLRAWCQAGFDHPTAAAALHVHRNTMRYRLKRAGEVSGFNLRSRRHLLALQLLLAE